MTTPASASQTDSPRTTNPLGQPNATAGPSRPSSSSSRSPFPQGLNLGSLANPLNGANNFLSLNGLNSQPGQPGQSGQNGTNGPNDPQALQARLMAAQQAMQGMQQGQTGQTGNPDSNGMVGGPGGLTMANAAQLLGNSSNAHSEQMLRQLQAIQASHARQGQRTTMGQPQSNGNQTAPSSANGPPRPPQPSSTQSAETTAPSPFNLTALNSSGTGPSIMNVQLTQQQKAMLAQQERFRTQATGAQPPSSMPSNPQIPTPTGTAPRPPGPPSQAVQQRKQFVQSLGAYYRSHNLPLPTEIFNGEHDGEVKVAGCWVDMFDLFMVIMRAQGVANAIKQPPESETWKRLFANSKLPNPLPEPLLIPLPPSHSSESASFPTTNPVQYLVGLYVAYIKGFEDQMQKHRQQLMQRQQAAQAAMAAGRPPSLNSSGTAPQQVGTPSNPTIPRSASIGTVGTPASAGTPTAATPAAPTPSAPTPSAPTASTPTAFQMASTPVTYAPTPTAPTPTAPTPGAASTPSVPAPNPLLFAPSAPGLAPSPTSAASAQPKFSSTTGNGRPVPAPIDTALASANVSVSGNISATPTPTQKRKVVDGVHSGNQTPQRPSSPKRARYKVEYKPIHVPMTGLAGWDERAVRSTFPKNNMAHLTHSIHELGIVDMEAILMGLRSRLPRELGYAIPVLSMLSMPHPEDQLDGLPLIHIKEIYLELLILLEEMVFGEDGYDAWIQKLGKRSDKPEIDLSTIGFMEYEQIGRHTDIDLAEDINGPGKWRKDRTGGRTDMILALVNLIRNFSLFDDNQSVMGRSPETFTVLSRIIDTRLARVPGWCTDDEPYSLVEYHSVCRDTIMILTNVGRYVSLPAVPKESVLSVYRLISRFLAGGLDVSNWRDTPYGWNVDPKYCPVPIITTLYRATEAFYNLAGPDLNREILGKTVPEAELVKLFESLVKLLPNTTRAIDGLCMIEANLVHAECTALALYSLTFLSSLSARAAMRALPGAATILRQTITKLMRRHPIFTKSPYSVLCRRLSETLGVLNGTVTCMGESNGLTAIGFSAGAGDGKGWKWASGIIEGGWMAGCEEVINECLTIPEVDKHTFAELDALWWAKAD